jgi:hypothetical protein
VKWSQSVIFNISAKASINIPIAIVLFSAITGIWVTLTNLVLVSTLKHNLIPYSVPFISTLPLAFCLKKGLMKPPPFHLLTLSKNKTPNKLVANTSPSSNPLLSIVVL